MKGFKKSVVFSDTIFEDVEDGDSDVFGEELDEDIDLEVKDTKMISYL